MHTWNESAPLIFFFFFFALERHHSISRSSQLFHIWHLGSPTGSCASEQSTPTPPRNSDLVRLRAFACLHQQCALLCNCDRTRACVSTLVAREIARAPNARSSERFQGVRHGKLRLSLRFPLPAPLVGWMRVQTDASAAEQPPKPSKARCYTQHR